MFNRKTAYDMRISDWSSDVCSSDLLVEIPARLLRFDIEGCSAGDRYAAVVARDIGRQIADADLHRIGRLRRAESPWQIAGGIGVEADRDGPAARALRNPRCGIGIALAGALRGTAESGHLAEQSVKRHRCVTQPQHGQCSKNGQHSDPGVALIDSYNRGHRFRA